MKLIECSEKNVYSIHGMDLPLKTAKRLEALGMTHGTKVSVLSKSPSAMIVTIRSARFALGNAIAKNIEVNGVYKCDDRVYWKSKLRKNDSF